MMLIGDEPQSYPSYRDIALHRDKLVAARLTVDLDTARAGEQKRRSFSGSPLGFVTSSAVNTLVLISKSRLTGSFSEPSWGRANMCGFDFRQAQRLTGMERQRNLYATKTDV